jgi:hypothetical protein
VNIDLEEVIKQLKLYVPQIKIGITYDSILPLILNQFDILNETIQGLQKDNDDLLKQIAEKQTVIDRLLESGEKND